MRSLCTSSSPGWAVPALSAFPHGRGASGHSSSWWPLVTPLHYVRFSCTGESRTRSSTSSATLPLERENVAHIPVQHSPYHEDWRVVRLCRTPEGREKDNSTEIIQKFICPQLNSLHSKIHQRNTQRRDRTGRGWIQFFFLFHLLCFQGDIQGQDWISYWGLCWGTSIASITTVGCSAWCHHIGSPSDLWEVCTFLGWLWCLPPCKTHSGWALSHSEIPLIPLTAPQQAKLQAEKVSYSHPEAFGHIHCYQAIREKCCAWADKGRQGGEMSHCAWPDPITHVLPQEDSRWAWIICVTSEHITWPPPLPRSAQLQIR